MFKGVGRREGCLLMNRCFCGGLLALFILLVAWLALLGRFGGITRREYSIDRNHDVVL